VFYDLINPINKDLEKLGMWEPLQDLLASPSDDMKVQALWVIGTAVQNNPAAQKAVRSLPRDAQTHLT
jgi:hsp70-interacting protein